jgi:hypothetical protein
MVTNAHAGVENSDPEIRALLNRHHEALRDALRAALDAARSQRQLPIETDVEATAEVLTALVYTINLRSRPDTDAQSLRRLVAITFGSIGPL